MAKNRLAILHALVLTFALPAFADEVGLGQSALDQTRAAYRAAGPFQETLEIVVDLPGRPQKRSRIDYGVAASGASAFMAMWSDGQEFLRVVARDGRMVAINPGQEGRYAQTTHDHDFAAALARLRADQASLAAPASLVAAQGGDGAAFLEALRLGALPPLEVAGSRPVVTEGQPPGIEIELRGTDARLLLVVDGETQRLRSMSGQIGQGEYQARMTGNFHFTASEPGARLVLPDLANWKALGTLAELESAGYPLGEPAPKLTIRSFAEDRDLQLDFPGAVVVLDFWATWCVPCWSALEHTQELAEWARTSGLPVRVFAVDTLEEVASLSEQREKVADFLKTRNLSLPVLLDFDRHAFAAFHRPGLPSLVIVGPDGRLARYYSGAIQDMVATVKKEVLDLLGGHAAGGPP
ncbi:MAG TPA: TlpA disulfide reductase family protein [Thermoanaerobaculia bacterium]|nr:TlpA disulfide reductase family protein [Thermoanaerobaculia bacterium]